MTVAFDTHTGRLRLDQATFDTLVAWARGAGEPGPELRELRDAGAIRNGVPHPAVWSGLQAVTEPTCRRMASLDDRGRQRFGEGWVSSEAAALLLDVPDGMRELVTVHPAFLPMAIARVVRLGPHPRPGSDPLHLPRDVYESLFATDAAERGRAAERLRSGASRCCCRTRCGRHEIPTPRPCSRPGAASTAVGRRSRSGAGRVGGARTRARRPGPADDQ